MSFQHPELKGIVMEDITIFNNVSSFEDIFTFIDKYKNKARYAIYKINKVMKIRRLWKRFYPK